MFTALFQDILGTQLIRRNDELALLYEKINIQKYTLEKGEKQYQQRITVCVGSSGGDGCGGSSSGGSSSGGSSSGGREVVCALSHTQ